jgi:hypothetical protein
MDRDGGRAVEQSRRTEPAGLPSVLAGLDHREPETRRSAVETIRNRIDEQPGTYVPTVPKLRAALTQPELERQEDVAYCLAELAREAPADVAPSIDEIVRFAAANERAPATRDLLRCLASVSEEHPDAVVDHVDELVSILTARRGYDRWGLRTLTTVARTEPTALESAVPMLTDALVTNPDANGVPALSALGRVARDGELSSFEFVEYAATLVEHRERAVRRNATGCLADVAHQTPSVVEPVCSVLTSALECDDPKTRANAAIAVARVAAGTPNAADRHRQRLLSLLDDEGRHVRANACLALGYGEVTEARRRLSELAADDPASNVRDRAAWAHDRLP